MVARERMAFDAYYRRWVPVIAIDIGRPDDTDIPLEEHPSIIDDVLLAGEDKHLFKPRPTRKHGDLEIVATEYLRKHGASIVSDMAEKLDIKCNILTRTLTSNADRFQIVGYQKIGKVKASVWSLK